jgi:hypothetical protein
LFPRVENRQQHESGKSARQCGRRHLRGDHCRSTGAFVRVGQMPLAPWTGGHQ